MAIKDLESLLKNMNPILSDKTYFICFSKNPSEELVSKSLGVFKEKEGTTLILEEKHLQQGLKKSGPHALITLNVYSDLSAVGFLSKITSKLAENAVSVNAISAYHHDHIFVPKESANKAVQLLKKLQQA
jgi:hypothetical protein